MHQSICIYIAILHMNDLISWILRCAPFRRVASKAFIQLSTLRTDEIWNYRQCMYVYNEYIYMS